MLTISTDRRRIEACEDPEGERLAVEAAELYLDSRLAMARALTRIEASGTFHLRGCSSVVQYAVKLGIPTADARVLVDLGHVLDFAAKVETESGPGAAKGPGDADAGEAVPAESVEDRIRAGRLHVENAALLAHVLHEPGATRPGEDWLGWAASMPTSTLRRCVNARLEEAAQGTRALMRIDLHVTVRARDGFERARVVASREAGTILTQGQTFALVVDRYLEASDELRRGEAARRVGATTEAPGERYVPAAVRRKVLARSQDRCEVPWCTYTTFLQMAHVRAHAAGGNREPGNLLRLCTNHHTQFDAGCLVFRGWREGRPTFGDRHGSRIAATGIKAASADSSDLPEAPTQDARGRGTPDPPQPRETTFILTPTRASEVGEEKYVDRFTRRLEESAHEEFEKATEQVSEGGPSRVADRRPLHGSRAVTTPGTALTGYG